MKVIVSLGYFDDSGEGRLLAVDLANGHQEVLLSYVPPQPLRVPTRGFTGACFSDDAAFIYAAGHAAVFRISTSSWTVDGTLHMPSFNDVHHVATRRDRIYVANTGSDAVDVFLRDGRFVGSYMLTPPWVLASKMQGLAPSAALDVHHAGWALEQNAGVQWSDSAQVAGRIADDDGYHTVQAQRGTTPYWQSKLPDRLHPNHICLLPSQTLVTCLYDGSVRDLGTLQVVYARPGSYPHDGIVADGWFYFTTIDGTLWALPLVDGALPQPLLQGGNNASTLPLLTRCWDVAEHTGKYGWCRGLLIESGSAGVTAVVGFTEVRQDRMPRHRWCARQPQGSRTGLVWLDLTSGRQLGWVDLTDGERHSKLYSVLPWRGD